MPPLFQVLDDPAAPSSSPLTVEYSRGLTNGPATPTFPANIPWQFNTTILGDARWVLNPDGTATCQPGGEGNYDISYNVGWANGAFVGGGNQVYAGLKVNGVSVLGTQRGATIGTFLQAAGACMGRMRVNGIVAGDIVEVSTTKTQGPSAAIVGGLDSGLFRLERVG